MKNSFNWGFLILGIGLLIIATLIGNSAKAASYDIKPDTVHEALTADRASVKAEKVMDGITDVVITLAVSETTTVQRVILQCDATTQSLNVFYYMDDVLGGKAKGATNFMINVYDNASQGYLPGGNVSVFDGANHKQNLRSALETLNKLNGIGYISFEFYESNGGIDHNPVAHSMLLPSSYNKKILEAIDSVPGSEGCKIDGGFTTVSPLKNLSDSI